MCNQFVDEMANKMGNTSEMQQLLAVTGAVTQGIGMTAEESANFSVEMAQVAGDLASFMNLWVLKKPFVLCSQR